MSSKLPRLAGISLLLLGAGCAGDQSQHARLNVSPVPAAKSQVQAVDGYYASAATAITQRDYGRALDLLQMARSRDPGDVRVMNAFGVVYDKLGRFDLSARYYALAAALDPNSEIVRSNQAYSALLQNQDPRQRAQAPVSLAAGGSAPPAQPAVRIAEAAVAAPPPVPAAAPVSTKSAPQIVAAIAPASPARTTSTEPVPQVATPRLTQPAASVHVAQPPAAPLVAPVTVAASVLAKTAPVVAVAAARTAQPTLTTPGDAVLQAAAPRPPQPAPPTRVAQAPAPAPLPAIAATVPVPAKAASVALAVAAQTVQPARMMPGQVVLQAAAPRPTPGPAVIVRVAAVAPAKQTARMMPGQTILQAAASRPAQAPAAAVRVAAISPAKQAARMMPGQAVLQTASRPVSVPPFRPVVIAAASKPAPQQLAKAVALPAQPTTRFWTQHAPLILINASGRQNHEESLRAALVRKGWSAPAWAVRQATPQKATVIRYPQGRLQAARGLAATLPGRADLRACADQCAGLQLVLGADALLWNAPRRSGRARFQS